MFKVLGSFIPRRLFILYETVADQVLSECDHIGFNLLSWSIKLRGDITADFAERFGRLGAKQLPNSRTDLIKAEIVAVGEVHDHDFTTDFAEHHVIAYEKFFGQRDHFTFPVGNG